MLQSQNSCFTSASLLAIIAKYDFPFGECIVELSMNKKCKVNSVCVDDWTPEFAIIAGNVTNHEIKWSVGDGAR